MLNTEPQWCALSAKFCHCTRRCDWYDRINDYADVMIRVDRELEQEGQPEHDLDHTGQPLRAGR